MSDMLGKIKATAAAGAIAAATAAAAPTIPPAVEGPGETGVIRFDPSQRRLFDDPSRVIVVNWHRQKGKDFTAAAKAVDNAIRTGQSWYIVSLTQRQADATFDKCKQCVKIIKNLLGIIGEDLIVEWGTEQFDKSLNQSFQFTAREIRLPGGGRVCSLPGRDPDTLAGLTGNIIFTEFGLFPNGGYDHWRVVFPLTTRGFQCVVISTPRGKNTKFYELFQNLEGAYSVHFCDIFRSVAEDGFVLRDNAGNPTTIEQFKRLYGDAAGFDREYGCIFSGDMSALIPWAELERAAELGREKGFVYRRFDGQQEPGSVAEFAGALAGRSIAVGWDVARRGHLSVIACNLIVPTRPAELVCMIAMRDCSFDFMRAAVVGLMDTTRASVGYGDATGLGMESNEWLEKKYRDRWTPFTFTASGKRDLASALRTAFSDAMQTLPPMDGPYKFVATDLYAIQKDDTGANLQLSETVNPLMEESHCDMAYALGLARLAGARSVRMPVPAPQQFKPAGW